MDVSNAQTDEARQRIAPVVADEPPPDPRPYKLYEYSDIVDPIWLTISSGVLRHRVQEELLVREPPQPFMGEVDPIPAPTAPLVEVFQLPGGGERRVIDLRVHKEQRLAKEAAEAAAKDPNERERRFREHRAAETAARHAAKPQNQNTSDVGEQAPQFDPATIEDREYDIDEVFGPNARIPLRFVDWKGRRARPVLTSDEYVVSVLGGQSCNKAFPEDVHAKASPSITGGLGLAHEGEPRRPPPGKSAVLDALLFTSLFANPAIQRVAGYASCILHAFATNVYWLYHNALQSYEGYYGASSRPLYHNDERAWGWTAFTSLGTYNPDYGGHMILWDLRLLICFPPGTTILIPRPWSGIPL
ncbi:hypothetical protein B0H13DRAFT_2382733 [Mycena leptocephala]|nr:hypothetical protein B0H13DRAFT_2382733 [Mycena leptocephala]